MKNLALIPARGGSKRIPRKNMRHFHGKPIIAYSILYAIQSGLFDEVMVSTDDNEIAKIAESYGAKVPFLRSASNSDDHATTEDVIDEVIESYKGLGIYFDNLCCVYATAPLILPGDLKRGLDRLVSGDFNSVFPVAAFSYPVWRGFELGYDSKTKLIWPEYQKSRSQDLKQVYHDAGQWYWVSLKKKSNQIFTNNSASIVLAQNQVQDIDTDEDWKMAELKYDFLRDEANDH